MILKDLSGNAPECRVAEAFLYEAVCRSDKEVELLDPAGLEALVRICDDALAMLPNQTRHRDADPRIIDWIYNDLIGGHGEEHCIVHDGDDWSGTGAATPPFEIKPSSSPESQFRNIVAICYEAMTGEPSADPERAIKAFVKRHKEQMGRQMPQENDLAS
ncbi:MAG: hypothetical protein ACREVY_17700 [Gammaproteobacteria bacterium]